MSWREIIVATRMPKIVYIVVEILKGLDLKFELCEPGDIGCNTAKVVITTKGESASIDESRLVLVEEDSDAVSISISIMLRYYGIVIPQEVIIGIDPGLRTGFAVIADGNVVFTTTLSSPIEVVDTSVLIAEMISSKFADSRFVIRVGAGSKLYCTLLLRGLSRKLSLDMIELVDEHHTTFHGGYENDQSSAVLIGARIGQSPFNTDLKIESKPGYVRALQHLFECISVNKNELSIEDARMILVGERTLEE
ncbi:MAG: hypothetical protein ACTSU3_11355, partial [Candidatus Thorarchaeota archaeon]